MSTALTCTLLLLAPVQPGKAYPRAELLVEPAWLAKAEGAKNLVILDARAKEAYAKGHIPGAAWVNHADWQKTFSKTQDKSAWQERIAALGIGDGSKIVVYDDAMNKDAARIWWILRYWGLKDARLLNGGWKAWTAGEHPVSKEAAEPKPATSLTLKARDEMHTDKGELLKLLDAKSAQIIDARSEGEFCGDTKMAKRGGAIPGAKHLEWKEVLEPKTHRFRPAAEIAKLFKESGIDVDRPAVTHCQSGGRAAVMAFTLELMGAKNVSNYYRGWSEWGNDPDAPVVRPEKKQK